MIGIDEALYKACEDNRKLEVEIEEKDKEIERLHYIIKEVREYANTDKNCIPKHIKDYINNLLDKEVN